MKNLNIVSLFDGMGCGRIAIDRIDKIGVNSYLASEIHNPSIKVMKYNYPAVKHIGDVTKVEYDFSENNYPLIISESQELHPVGEVDLLMGGSPCQDLSFAGTQRGFITKEKIEIHTLEHYLELKNKGFAFEGESYLFWEYIRLLKDIKPRFFLLENVSMSEKWEKVFNATIGFAPYKANSSLVSAQKRKRFYWVGMRQQDGSYTQAIIPPLKDKKIYIKDILQDDCEVDKSYYASEKVQNTLRYLTNQQTIFSPALLQRPRGVNKGGYKGQDGKTPTMSASNWHYNHLLIKDGTKEGYMEAVPGDSIDLSFPNSSTKRSRMKRGKCGTLLTGQIHGIINNDLKMRYFTEIECERLQTVPDNYTAIASKTDRYKMLGNGWTVDVIAHILSNLPF